MSTKLPKDCRKCGETLHYECIGGMRVYRTENGRQIYSAWCPKCKRRTDEPSPDIGRRKATNVAPKACDELRRELVAANTVIRTARSVMRDPFDAQGWEVFERALVAYDKLVKPTKTVKHKAAT